MRLFSSGLVALFLFSAAAFSAHATIRLTDDEEIVVESHEVIDDDLIVSASSIRIDGLVKGDLIAFGTNIVIEGIVEEDLIAVGKTVYLNGRVGDDASIGAYALGLGEKARIGDDLFDFLFYVVVSLVLLRGDTGSFLCILGLLLYLCKTLRESSKMDS